MKSATFIALALSAVCFFSPFAFAQEICGTIADADAVFMLDKTGSISSLELAQEKQAAAEFLGYAEAAAVKPAVAIGTFNVASPFQPAARIEENGQLTSSYGHPAPGASGLYEVISNITLGWGATNLGDAIIAARNEISTHGTRPEKYIILISDGIPTQPGNGGNGCIDGEWRSYARDAAAAAKAAGIKIVTIHYGDDGGCPAGTGAAFLLNSISSGASYYFEGLSGMQEVFASIAQDAGCDDQNECTLDSCDPGTHVCTHTSICPDEEPDCLGVPGGSAAYDRCGVCNGNGMSCLGCSELNLTPRLMAMDDGARRQKNQVQRAARMLSRVICRNDAKNRAFIRKVRRSANNLYLKSWRHTWAIPRVLEFCSNTLFCVQISHAGEVAAYNQTALRLRKTSKNVLARVHPYDCPVAPRPTPCPCPTSAPEGNCQAAFATAGARIRASQVDALWSSALQTYRQNVSISNSLPSASSSCD